ncbi:nucleotidyltransferase family protein [Clostridium bowmanii]|uniref:nucleotidyltransferase family protein n=1 Tax=Clostridium bowmanii TaxID=132925 RepID=UPI001C0D3FE7|nr:nucleotidyltransferase family protein [Clostridium bowmanii]MBU3190621.1 nucleotidyltransferase family protein [Clostridium bowmanii]MCA1075154.1 nucleotidyltransferase family protein [Clostridium bowmanii]
MNNNVEQLLIKKNCTIKDALGVIDNGAKGIILVVDGDNKLIGTITDGDIRRALLKGLKLEESLQDFIHYNPVVAYNDMGREEIKDIFIKKAVKQVPILNREGKVERLLDINDLLLPEGKENFVIIMAGGLGTRLKGLTEELPKSMLKIGQDPILQHIINNYKQYGYNKILLSVNYKAEIIQNYFQSGYAYGVKIDYVKETKRLGTGGGIRLARGYIDKPFFVINGDIFTNLNVENMMDFHINNKYDLTVGVRKHGFTIPYGIINSEKCIIKSIEEKPTKEYLINAGIYCINPDVIDYIPKDEYYEITELINKCIKQGKRVGSYEIKEYWMDIGKIEDYYKVNEDVSELLCLDKEGEKNND